MIKAVSISDVVILLYNCRLASNTTSLALTSDNPSQALSTQLLILSRLICSSLPLRFLTLMSEVICNPRGSYIKKSPLNGLLKKIERHLLY